MPERRALSAGMRFTRNHAEIIDAVGRAHGMPALHRATGAAVVLIAGEEERTDTQRIGWEPFFRVFDRSGHLFLLTDGGRPVPRDEARRMLGPAPSLFTRFVSALRSLPAIACR